MEQEPILDAVMNSFIISMQGDKSDSEVRVIVMIAICQRVSYENMYFFVLCVNIFEYYYCNEF